MIVINNGVRAKGASQAKLKRGKVKMRSNALRSAASRFHIDALLCMEW